MKISNKIILKDLKGHLLKYYGNSIVDVILFGSRTRSNYNQYSDYDIIIVLKNDFSGEDENKILDLCYDINLKYEIILDVHITSTNELKNLRGKQYFFKNAIQTGIHA